MLYTSAIIKVMLTKLPFNISIPNIDINSL